MAAQRRKRKEDIIGILRRAGFSPEVIDEVASQLPDVVDLDQHSSLFLRYGITIETLTDRLGASP
jgi:hypothetical protein